MTPPATPPAPASRSTFAFAFALALAATVVATAAIGCTGAGDPDAPGDPADVVDRARVTSVSYDVAWSLGAAVVDDAAGSLVVDTDLGYRVTLERGYVVTHSAALVPCDGESSATVATRIQASHGEVADPSATSPPRVEDLLALAATPLGERSFAAADYCHVHYLVSRGNLDTVQLPDEVRMIGRSLYLEGRFRAPGAADEVAFVIDSADAWGKLEPLAIDASDRDAEHVDVAIQRRLDALFDGVDLAVDADPGLAVLANLVDHTAIAVTAP